MAAVVGLLVLLLVLGVLLGPAPVDAKVIKVFFIDLNSTVTAAGEECGGEPVKEISDDLGGDGGALFEECVEDVVMGRFTRWTATSFGGEEGDERRKWWAIKNACWKRENKVGGEDHWEPRDSLTSDFCDIDSCCMLTSDPRETGWYFENGGDAPRSPGVLAALFVALSALVAC
jgi:hypothetical protein